MYSVAFRLVVLAVLHAAVSSAPGQCDPQQLGRLVPSGGVGVGQFGTTLALSGDGNTLIVGAPFDNSNIGGVYIFVRSGVVWAQQGPKLLPTGGMGPAKFGSWVGLSADGNTAVIGAPLDNSSAGAAYIFGRAGGIWSQQGAKITVPAGTPPAQLGAVVTVSRDANTVLLGANGAGAAYIFIRSGPNPPAWVQQGTGFAPFTGGVALSADGNTAMVGYSQSAGAVYTYTRAGSSWAQTGPTITASPINSIHLGASLGLDADGRAAIIGAPNDSSNAGAAYFYSRPGTTWVQQQPKLVPNVSASTLLGAASAINASGENAIVGMTGTTAERAVYIFARGGGVVQQSIKLPSPSATADAFGRSVSISDDGNTVAIGAPADTSNIGAAYVYALGAPVFTQQPSNMSVAWHNRALFLVTASPSSGISYAWRRSGIPLTDGPTPSGAMIVGSSTAVLEIHSVALMDNASTYDCVISNGCYTARSGAAVLTVFNPCPADFNQSGATTVQDVFDFLAAWFSGCP